MTEQLTQYFAFAANRPLVRTFNRALNNPGATHQTISGLVNRIGTMQLIHHVTTGTTVAFNSLQRQPTNRDMFQVGEFVESETVNLGAVGASLLADSELAERLAKKNVSFQEAQKIRTVLLKIHGQSTEILKTPREYNIAIAEAKARLGLPQDEYSAPDIRLKVAGGAPGNAGRAVFAPVVI